ncbi:MAG TPA: T9SS type A sorting domain-containing protein, partial [Cyclobacteriaceae bacterium]|nr:T9SS type A sorting domain-containing protein [Cyclobacteriaceae bacterium]
GTNTVTNAQIQFSLNGIVTETKTFSSLNLASSAEATANFASISLSEGSSYNFSFTILQTNGGIDARASNNSKSITTQIPVSTSLPLFEQFTNIPSGKPAGWQITNPDGLTTWNKAPSLQAMYLNFYDYADQQGSPDLLITPVLDLTTAAVASLNFDYAYAQYQGGSTDGLRVLVSSACNFNASPVVIFNKSGSALATSTSTSSSFTPTSSQWATSIISLNQFLGQKVQIAFEGINGYGNNLYLDNVLVTNAAFTGFTLNGLVKPSPVSCNSTVAPVISVTNLGNATITSFTANVYVNNQLTVQKFSGIQLTVGSTANFTLSTANFQSGINSFSIAVKNPNGITSAVASTDSLHTSLVINSVADKIPLRENFDDNFVDRWSTINPQSGLVWHTSVTNTSKLNSMVFPAFGDTNLGQQAWLVSPVLDFSKSQTASVNFESSYAYNVNGIETLQVYSSSDCGVTFDSLLFNTSGELLSNTDSNSAWIPSDDTQWTKNHISLNNLAGKENVRLAFVATNGNGNNLYVDNIEFFMDDVNPHPTIESQYSVYGGAGSPVKVTFNLPERELVRMQIYDLMGHVVADNLLPDTLNQTYTIDFPQESRGLYVVRVQTASSIGATKVLMGF